VQSLERSSLDVWSGANSGAGRGGSTTISYYVKGPVVGFLLDCKIRRATADKKNFDDVMRLAYKRYSGERGFTAPEFRATTEEVAGVDLKEWFRRAVESADELDYSEALDWYGLQFARVDEDVVKNTAAEPAITSKTRDEPAAKAAEKPAPDSVKEPAKKGRADGRAKWRLEVRPDATLTQRAHLSSLLASGG
jgi:predicted metalloprotease with PDZ domain